MNTVKHKIGEQVIAEKNGTSIIGTITEVIPEMQYEITQSNGCIRTVDHAHMIDVLPENYKNKKS